MRQLIAAMGGSSSSSSYSGGAARKQKADSRKQKAEAVTATTQAASTTAAVVLAPVLQKFLAPSMDLPPFVIDVHYQADGVYSRLLVDEAQVEELLGADTSAFKKQCHATGNSLWPSDSTSYMFYVWVFFANRCDVWPEHMETNSSQFVGRGPYLPPWCGAARQQSLLKPRPLLVPKPKPKPKMPKPKPQPKQEPKPEPKHPHSWGPVLRLARTPTGPCTWQI